METTSNIKVGEFGVFIMNRVREIEPHKRNSFVKGLKQCGVLKWLGDEEQTLIILKNQSKKLKSKDPKKLKETNEDIDRCFKSVREKLRLHKDKDPGHINDRLKRGWFFIKYFHPDNDPKTTSYFIRALREPRPRSDLYKYLFDRTNRSELN